MLGLMEFDEARVVPGVAMVCASVLGRLRRWSWCQCVGRSLKA